MGHDRKLRGMDQDWELGVWVNDRGILIKVTIGSWEIWVMIGNRTI